MSLVGLSGSGDGLFRRADLADAEARRYIEQADPPIPKRARVPLH